VATTSAPHEPLDLRGRPDGAAAARTEELYGRYLRTISGLCRALLRDRAEAEDATQQTFLSAHRALLNGTDPREPAAWLATIARNECWTRVRARMREPLPVSELETASTEPDPYAEAVRRADLAALWSAIEELPRLQRDALLLREFGGLSYEELSEALAVSGSAVESLLFRARQRLRARLRAAYASFGGASWLETLTRLFGGAPVAAKVAAISVGAATVTGGAVVVPQALEQSRRGVPPAHVHTTAPPVPKARVPAVTAPAVVLAAQEAPAPRRAIARDASSEEQRVTVTHDGAEAGQHDGGDVAEHAARARTDGSEGGVSVQQNEPAQQGTNGSGDEAGVTVQTELEPTTTATTESHDGGGVDGGSVDGGGASTDPAAPPTGIS
jgi:RNA polymerase sigma-70 factor (ECF subfamily)